MNHKKLQRLYVEERLQVLRRGGRRKRISGTLAPVTLPQGPEPALVRGFFADTLTDGTGSGSRGSR